MITQSQINKYLDYAIEAAEEKFESMAIKDSGKTYQNMLSNLQASIRFSGLERALNSYIESTKSKEDKRRVALVLNYMLNKMDNENSENYKKLDKAEDAVANLLGDKSIARTQQVTLCAAALKYALNLYDHEKPKQGENNGEEE